jgi:hypothetical protein
LAKNDIIIRVADKGNQIYLGSVVKMLYVNKEIVLSWDEGDEERMEYIFNVLKSVGIVPKAERKIVTEKSTDKEHPKKRFCRITMINGVRR